MEAVFAFALIYKQLLCQNEERTKKIEKIFLFF